MSAELFATRQAKRAAYEALLGELGPAVALSASETALYRAVVERLHRLPHFNWTGVYVLAEPDTLVRGPYLGAPTEHVKIPVGRGICGQSAADDATVVVDDVTASENYLACSLDTRSEIVVPIRVGGAYHAQIDVDSHTVSAFDAVDREMLERLAEMMGARIAGLGG